MTKTEEIVAIDDVERSEFESQMVNLGVTYMNDGMALELEELIGNDVQDLERISFSVDLQERKRRTTSTDFVNTFEIVEANKESVTEKFHYRSTNSSGQVWT